MLVVLFSLEAQKLCSFLQIKPKAMLTQSSGAFDCFKREGYCHDSVNSKGLFIVRTRLPPRVYSLSPKSSKYKDVHRPSGVTV